MTVPPVINLDGGAVTIDWEHSEDGVQGSWEPHSVTFGPAPLVIPTTWLKVSEDFKTWDRLGDDAPGGLNANLVTQRFQLGGESPKRFFRVSGIVELEGIDLTGQWLRYANLSGANLQRAILTGADLDDTDFIGADLSLASLRDALLRGTNFRNANLQGVDLRNINDPNVYPQSITDNRTVNFSNADLRDCDLREAHLQYGTNFRGADLSGGSDLRRAVLSGCDFTDANLTDADFSEAELSDAIFVGANVRSVCQLQLG